MREMSTERAMKRVAVFGNAGGGKSTLARRLAELTGLPLHPLDVIQFRPGGGEVSLTSMRDSRLCLGHRASTCQGRGLCCDEGGGQHRVSRQVGGRDLMARDDMHGFRP